MISYQYVTHVILLERAEELINRAKNVMVLALLKKCKYGYCNKDNKIAIKCKECNGNKYLYTIDYYKNNHVEINHAVKNVENFIH